MEKEPLLPYLSPRMKAIPIPPPLCPLPEDDEISLPLPLTPSELKNHLIFGPSSSSSSSSSSPKDTSSILDALNLSLNSPRPSSSSTTTTTTTAASCLIQESTIEDPLLQQSPKSSWLIDSNYPWTNTHLHRSKTAPAMAVINEVMQHQAMPKPQFGSQSIVRQAVVLFVMSLSLGVITYWFNRDNFAI